MLQALAKSLRYQIICLEQNLLVQIQVEDFQQEYQGPVCSKAD